MESSRRRWTWRRRMVAVGAALACATLGVAALGVQGDGSAATVRGSVIGTTSRSPVAAAAVTPPAGRCIASGDKTATDRVSIGQAAGVTLTFALTCTESTGPLHVVFVLDTSESLGSRLGRATEFVSETIMAMRLADQPADRVGIVSYAGSVSVLSHLSNDERRLLAVLQGLAPRPGSALDVAIGTARTMLLSGPTDPLNPIRMMILVGKLENDGGCEAAARESVAARRQGVVMAASRWGGGGSCADRLVSDEWLFYSRANCWRWLDEMDRLRFLATHYRIVISDTLPDTIRYVPGSARPEPSYVHPGEDSFRWSTYGAETTRLEITYAVEPFKIGRQPASIEARAVYTDGKGTQHEFLFPVPWIEAVWPTVTPRPSKSPTPTASAVPSQATMVGPPSATPAEGTSWPAYLPCLPSGG